jgi:3-oxoacyl-[acyl-carrier-protein] synthase II
MNENIVITGVGLVTSLGHSLDETWAALLEGRTGIRPIEGFPADGFSTKVAAEVAGLDAKELGIPAREERVVDTHTFMLIKCLRDAFKNSGLEASSVDRDEIAFFAGMGGVDYRIEDLLPAINASMDKGGNLDFDKFYSGGFREIHPLWPLAMLNNIAFCQAAIGLVLRGENTVLSPYAESGAQSIYEAAVSVAEGRSPAALAAGVSEKFSAINLARETLAGVMGTGACRPFSSERDGTVLGEGCAVLSMESESSAAKRRAVPLARVGGYGEAFAWQSESEPDAGTISRAMGTALDNAGLRPADIDVLIAHGDGTLKGDANEIEAVSGMFSGCDVKVYSSKGTLGHMLAGSPAVDVALAVKMIEAGAVPPTLNTEPLDEKINFSVVTGEPLKKDIRRVMIGCRSREGHCASLVVEAVR